MKFIKNKKCLLILSTIIFLILIGPIILYAFYVGSLKQSLLTLTELVLSWDKDE